MKNYQNNQWIRLAVMAVALELIAISINLFYAPHKVAPGGATGIAILAQEAFGLPIGLVTLGVNAVMLALAFWLLDRQTARRILLGSLLLPLLLAVTPQTMIVKDRLLAVIVGSVIFAVGVSLNYRIDASSGGTTVPPMIFKKYFGWKTAIGLFAVDAAVSVFNIPVSGIESFILALFAIGLTSLVMNYVASGFDRRKTVYILSDLASEQIKNQITENSDHGLTVHQVLGGYSEKPLQMLMVVVDQADFHQLVAHVKAADPDAFILAVDAAEVHGGSFSI